MSHCLYQQLNTDITKHSPLESFFPTSWHVSLFGPTAQHRYHQTLTLRIVFTYFQASLIFWSHFSIVISPNTEHKNRIYQHAKNFNTLNKILISRTNNQSP